MEEGSDLVLNRGHQVYKGLRRKKILTADGEGSSKGVRNGQGRLSERG